MIVTINSQKLAGTVEVPPSKSIAHRAIISASFAKNTSLLHNIELSDDIKATIECARSFGAKIDYADNEKILYVNGESFFHWNDFLRLDCAESGSTFRFFLPLSLLRPLGALTEFTGRGRLFKRPLQPILSVFDEKGIRYSYTETVKIEAKNLCGGIFKINGDVSSQFITGLLFTLSGLDNDSEVVLTTPLHSRSYIDLTTDVMDKFGVNIINEKYEKFIIKGGRRYKERDFKIEGDYSQAAFWLVANAIGNNVICKGLNTDTMQGDKAILNIIACQQHEFDVGEIPDLVPILAVLFSLKKGRRYLTNAKRLRLKESDRLSAITCELCKLGAKIIEKEDYLIIDGVDTLNGGVLHSHGDHRIAMALSIAATRANGKVTIEGAECVNKSYPNFWRSYNELLGTKI